MRTLFTLALFVAVTLMSVPASAQSRQVVVDQLDFISNVLAGDDYVVDRGTSTAGSTIGLLGGNSEAYLEVWLEEGKDYIITAACDEDCNDLDLDLRLGSGELMTEDRKVDDVPVLQHTASSTGWYLLGIDMVDCETNFCYFGYRIFHRVTRI